ncbi:30S ribosomal protein S21 [Eisenibacter elegans]|jgi:small subunit ribosomal protein S21|uniref:30S ribosomal protein S21 n=1 Tax=Eisenibacter elegans TaxID=997 RepID=UPI000418EB66|nr:30S ribosomal protein S21 [Eisenibacter elegans]
MIIVTVKENESIDKALKRFKKKFERTGILRRVRSRGYYEKPSVRKRTTKLKAIYRERMRSNAENA